MANFQSFYVTVGARFEFKRWHGELKVEVEVKRVSVFADYIDTIDGEGSTGSTIYVEYVARYTMPDGQDREAEHVKGLDEFTRALAAVKAVQSVCPD